jgi:hypothetical protein
MRKLHKQKCFLKKKMKGENFTKLAKENVKFAIPRFAQMFLEG